MRLTYQGCRVVVLDDVLTGEGAELVWRWFQSQQIGVYAPGNGARRPVDGIVYASSSTTIDAAGSAKTLVDQTLLAAAALAKDVVGVAERDWSSATRTCWSYPAGTQAGWHNDGPDTQTGAFVWYMHPRWGASWGGELLVVDSCASDMVKQSLESGLVVQGATESPLSTDAETDVLFAVADPLCFQPRPNRMVLLTSDTFHTVRRVDPSAGDRLRSSLAGFFIKASTRMS